MERNTSRLGMIAGAALVAGNLLGGCKEEGKDSGKEATALSEAEKKEIAELIRAAGQTPLQDGRKMVEAKCQVVLDAMRAGDGRIEAVLSTDALASSKAKDDSLELFCIPDSSTGGMKTFSEKDNTLSCVDMREGIKQCTADITDGTLITTMIPKPASGKNPMGVPDAFTSSTVGEKYPEITRNLGLNPEGKVVTVTLRLKNGQVAAAPGRGFVTPVVVPATPHIDVEARRSAAEALASGNRANTRLDELEPKVDEIKVDLDAHVKAEQLWARSATAKWCHNNPEACTPAPTSDTTNPPQQ